MQEYFARCAGGFEPLLADELHDLGAHRVRPLQGGVAFFGSLEDAYRVCLFSRLATRVQLVLARIDANTADVLYENVYAFPWEEHIPEGATIAIRAHGTSSQLRNTQFTALKVKDALCDALREKRSRRPNVDTHSPDISIDIAIHKTRATLYLNLTGASLHRRGYREDGLQTLAPLKETLAAGMLRAAGWHKYVDQMRTQGEHVGTRSEHADTRGKQSPARKGARAENLCCFIDPMCGSGTLAIEAALMAADIAPGLLRDTWGFTAWLQHDSCAWERVQSQAQARMEQGLVFAQRYLRIVASDIDAEAIEIAQDNAHRARVNDIIEFHMQDAASIMQHVRRACKVLPASGLMALNPPYGQRMFEQGQLKKAYRALSASIDELPDGWNLAIITPDASIDTSVGSVPIQTIDCYNGPIETTVRIYKIAEETRCVLEFDSLAGKRCTVPVAEANTEQFVARLRKVAKERAKWARKNNVSCYRIYDADLPDYAFAIDIYHDKDNEDCAYIHIAEYQAPASVDAQRAAHRLHDALAVIPALFEIDEADVFVKVRRHEKGGGQYRDAQEASKVVHVQEAGHVFEVDMAARLDTGLFLDHRDTRTMVQEMAAGRRFLNLFAYTGSASVYAAAGNAVSTTTVDLSRVYLDWAKRNMKANGFDGPEHRFVQADVLAWLQEQRKRQRLFDVVFCDVPTFSNSKRMGKNTFDVQRDHVNLIQAVCSILDKQGTLLFSCNRRSFKLDREALLEAGLNVEDITARTIPYDFARNPKIHRCFLITHRR